MKRSAQNFIATPSGTRFRRHYETRVARRRGWSAAVAIAGGVALILLGIAMLILPGPGLLAIATGACLIAGESLTVARVFDRIDKFLTTRYRRWRSGH